MSKLKYEMGEKVLLFGEIESWKGGLGYAPENEYHVKLRDESVRFLKESTIDDSTYLLGILKSVDCYLSADSSMMSEQIKEGINKLIR